MAIAGVGCHRDARLTTRAARKSDVRLYCR
jgi:hypothetical protein